MRANDLGAEFGRPVRITDGSSWVSALPDRPGVYVVALARLFGRLRGDSDILYIGSAGKIIGGRPSTIRKRWRNRWTVPAFEPEKTMRDMLKTMVAEGEDLSVICACMSGDLKETLRRESELIDQCFRDHRELPPLNRARPAIG